MPPHVWKEALCARPDFSFSLIRAQRSPISPPLIFTATLSFFLLPSSSSPPPPAVRCYGCCDSLISGEGFDEEKIRNKSIKLLVAKQNESRIKQKNTPNNWQKSTFIFSPLCVRKEPSNSIQSPSSDWFSIYGGGDRTHKEEEHSRRSLEIGAFRPFTHSPLHEEQ